MLIKNRVGKLANKNVVLIATILFGMTLIPLGDTAAKLLIQNSVDPIFVAWNRLALGFLIVLPLSGLKAAEIKDLCNWKVVLRGLVFLAAVTSIIKAVETEPLANVFGAFFIGPILSYFFAAIFLQEKITLTRSIFLLCGFFGALLVIKPGVDISIGMVYATLAGFFYGVLLVKTRWLSGLFRPRLILLSTLIVGAIILMPFGVQKIPPINSNIVFLLLVSALASALGNLIIIEVSRRLPASVVAPFIYTQLIAATVFTIVIFKTFPDIVSLLGLGILFSFGIGSFVVASREKAIKD